MACMLYFARCINVIFDSLLAQLVKYDVCTTRKIKFLLLSWINCPRHCHCLLICEIISLTYI